MTRRRIAVAVGNNLYVYGTLEATARLQTLLRRLVIAESLLYRDHAHGTAALVTRLEKPVQPMNRPLVLLGATRSRAYLDQMAGLGWGRMWTRETPSLYYDTEPWGFDNGAYGAWMAGVPFPTTTFQDRLVKARRMATPPVVAVTPDIVAAGERSLEFSLDWRAQLPDDWPWFLAVQDGMQVSDVVDALPAFAGLFLGGSTAFKRTAQQWADLAHAAGTRFHYGRASLPRKVDHAIRVGADSLDSAFPLWTTARFAEFVTHWVQGSAQRELHETLCLAGPEGEWY